MLAIACSTEGFAAFGSGYTDDSLDAVFQHGLIVALPRSEGTA